MARFTLALVLILVVLSALVDRHHRQAQTHVFTGTVREWHPGESIVMASEQTDPGGFAVRLRNTKYEGRTDLLGPGSNVTISYRMVGESQPLADKVHVNH